MCLPPFHVAIPVRSIAETRAFYTEVLGCDTGRATSTWIDISLFGHQLSAHVCPRPDPMTPVLGLVDEDQVPIPHIGTVLPWPTWEALVERVRLAKVDFLLAPRVRFAGEPAEQGTFFIEDPAGNALEFKAMRNVDELFAANEHEHQLRPHDERTAEYRPPTVSLPRGTKS